MKKIVVFLTIILVMSFSNVMGRQNQDETVGIKKAAMEYIEGWYEGNTDRIIGRFIQNWQKEQYLLMRRPANQYCKS